MYSKLSECEQRKPCIWCFSRRKMASLFLGSRYFRALGSDKLIIIHVLIYYYIIIVIIVIINCYYYMLLLYFS